MRTNKLVESSRIVLDKNFGTSPHLRESFIRSEHDVQVGADLFVQGSVNI